MKKTLKIIIMCLLLAGCGQDDEQSKNADVQKNSGVFSATLMGNEYKIDVSCSYFDKDYFQFKSDKSDVTDTNGDGIIISGMESNGKFVLTIIDHEKTYSTGNLANFKKSNEKAEGSGTLFQEGTAATHDVQFTVTCS